MKISQVFLVYQYHQITDEELYYSQGNIPVYTGDNELKGYWDRCFSTDITLPCLSYPVKGFNGIISIQEEPFDANNTAVLCIKEEYKNDVVLEWMKYILPHLFFQKLTNREGISYLSKESVETIEFDLISLERQLEQLDIFKKIDKMYHVLMEQKNEIVNIMEKQIVLSEDIQNNVPINKILKYVSRNDCLSESGLYQRGAVTEDKIVVLSGSSDAEIFGMIDTSQKGIHWLENRQALHLVTRGNAGKLNFLEKGNYATNTNAFLLYIPYDKWEELNITNDEEEKVYLKYLKCYLQHSFYNVSSNSDLSAFPLTETMKEMRMPLFQFNEEMCKIVRCIERMEKIYSVVISRIKEIEKLRSYKIIY